MKHIFRVGIDGARNFLGCLLFARKFCYGPQLQLQNLGCGFLSGFYSRLMVSIDVDQRTIKTNRAFVERDQRTEVKLVDLRQADRDRFSSALVKGGTGASEEPVEIIAARNSRLDLERFSIGTRPVARHLDKCNKEIQNSVSKLLNVCMLIG